MDKLLSCINSSYDIARCLDPIEDLQKKITLDNERREAWSKQLRGILDTAPPGYTVGVAGGTGSGKSTLLCALLGSSCLPTSSSRASTAAVTKISYHEHQFLKAEIHFLTEVAWREDISIAQQDIMSENEKDVDKDAIDSSLAKLQAVYPGYTKAQLLVAKPDDLIKDLGDVLQQPKIIEDIESHQFVKELEAFVATTGKPKERQHWPLVSYTQIFINSEFLKPGMTLVDLPGSGDSNAARNKVAKNYLKNVDALWIVGRIQRIVDDKATNDWIKMMAGKFFADGRSGKSAVTFIATHVDETPLYPEHLDDEQSEKLRSFDQFYKETNEKLKIAISDLECLRRRDANDITSLPDNSLGAGGVVIKQEESERLEISALVGGMPSSKENDLQSSIMQLQSALNEIDRERIMLLTYARNQWIQTYIRSDFKRRILANANGTENYDMNLDIPVICVASRAFLVLNHLGSGASALGAFRSEHETGIPLLRSHAIRHTLKFRKRPARLLLQEARALASEMSLHLGQKPVPTTSSNRKFLEGVNESLAVLQKDLKLIVSNARSKFEEQICDFRTQLANGIDEAANKAPVIMQELTCCNARWNTYRAIMRQTGERGIFDFNGALCEPIIEKSNTFHNLFTKSLPLLLAQLHKELLLSVENTLSQITANAEPSIDDEVKRAAEGARVRHLTDGGEDKSYQIVSDFQRDLVYSFATRLREKLTFHYKEVAQESGIGMLSRMKNANVAYINEKGDEIFTSLNIEIKTGLKELVTDTFRVVDKTTADMAAKVTRAFEALSASLPSYPDSEIQHRKNMQIFLEDVLATSASVEASLLRSISSEREDTSEYTEGSEYESDSEDGSEESTHEGFEESMHEGFEESMHEGFEENDDTEEIEKSEDTEEIEMMLTQ